MKIKIAITNQDVMGGGRMHRVRLRSSFNPNTLRGTRSRSTEYFQESHAIALTNNQ
ncbi:hypothetical protein LC593_34425 [Nostoc sp. CHAB 5844]|nr:hypothetical protein [Nostoc sp. CHAB 5844]